MNKLDPEILLDNVATCSQHPEMCRDENGDEPVIRECVRLNVVNPLTKKIDELEAKHKEAMSLLDDLHEWMGDIEQWPPGDCLKRMFLLDGSHMALVNDPDEGQVWHTHADAVSFGYEILEEVNSPCRP